MRDRGAAAPPSLGEIGLDQFEPYLMNRLMGRYNNDLQDALRALGLTTAQMRALAVLAARPAPTVKELAVFAVTEQSTLSRTLDGMEAQGLVSRSPREDDARAREVRLTETGREVFARAWPLMFEARERMFRGVGPEERAAFRATLAKLLANIRRHEL